MTTTMKSEAATEASLRRRATKLGLVLRKGRCRVVGSTGGYMLVDADTNAIVAGATPMPFFLDLQDVEEEILERAS